MKVLLVHAHPEPRSFNGSLTTAARNALEQAGHAVQVSDLYHMRWDPVSDRRNFTTTKNGKVYRQTEEEMFAASRDGFAADVKAELDKLLWCDTLILQFPLWWFSMPAIMKGWVDRVFVMGPVYGRGAWYDKGKFRGKRAMVSVTTGSIDSMFTASGINGSIRSVLEPIHRGILWFTGFDVAEPWVVHAPVMLGDDEREACLAEYAKVVADLGRRALLTFPSLEQYDPETYLPKA